MGKTLLSIDWDYFVPIKKEWCGSYLENAKNTCGLWYKRYIKGKMRGQDIEQIVDAAADYDKFWQKIRSFFNLTKSTKVYVSDSHRFSYLIAKENFCDQVYLFDAHADLGYGGLDSLNFELNCANWLGKLFKNKVIQRASIIYSPFTYESAADFSEINRAFDIKYETLNDLPENIDVSAVHICRSGAWTPPWLDHKFYHFVGILNIPYRLIDCAPRVWNTKKLNLSAQISYLLC